MQKLTLEMLDQQWPEAVPGLIDAVLSTQSDVFNAWEINTPLRQAHFMAQISHESLNGARLEENLRYTRAERIREVWPSRFKTVDAARPFVKNPSGLACKVYNGRMGNALGTSDGYVYRGRGFLQLTGRDAYAKLAEVARLPLLEQPELAAQSKGAFNIAGATWSWKQANRHADQDDVEEVTLAINGGRIGLADRREQLRDWRALLSA